MREKQKEQKRKRRGYTAVELAVLERLRRFSPNRNEQRIRQAWPGIEKAIAD